MRHPDGRCGRCGERIYAHIDGGDYCPNCGHHVPRDNDAGDGDSDDDGDGDDSDQRRQVPTV